MPYYSGNVYELHSGNRDECRENQRYVIDATGQRFLQTLNIVDAKILGSVVNSSALDKPPKVVKDVVAQKIENAVVRRRLHNKCTALEWEQDAATASTPMVQPEEFSSAVAPEKFDTALESLCGEEQVTDIQPSNVAEMTSVSS